MEIKHQKHDHKNPPYREGGFFGEGPRPEKPKEVVFGFSGHLSLNGATLSADNNTRI